MKISKLRKSVKNKIKGLLNKLPYIKTLHKLNSNSKYPAGHYYSSVISIEDIKERQDQIWIENQSPHIQGIDLRIEYQLNLLSKIEKFYPDLPFYPKHHKDFRYYYENGYYSYNDAIILFGIIRHFQPKNIVEIGSGFSSAVILDTNEHFFNNNIKITLIEPFPDTRLNHLVSGKGTRNSEIIAKKIQEVSLNKFKELLPGDILFIDSSHVVKTGSDVHYIVFQILPILKKGVIIHFHDIHFPFEYPKSWILNGIGWNEVYFLRAFLMFNNDFKILHFSDFLHRFYKESFAKMPLTYKSTGSNFWIEKH